MPVTPADLTVMTLSHAKGDQLKYWIDELNQNAGKRILTKGGKVRDLRVRIADYCGLDLSSPPAIPVPVGPPTRDLEIQKRQWAHLRALGEEWKRSPDSFQLCEDPALAGLHPRLHRELLSMLASASSSDPGIVIDSRSLSRSPVEAPGTVIDSRSPRSPSRSPIEAPRPETVHALLQATKTGDLNVLLALLRLQGAIEPTTSRSPVEAPRPETIQALLQTTKTGDLNVLSALFRLQGAIEPTTLLPAPLAPAVPPSVAPVAVNAASVLESAEQEIEALNRASNLRDVILQLEGGAVAQLRELYGPKKGRAPHPLWPRIKVTINRREKLLGQLMHPDEFAGDKARFFAFFTSAKLLPKKRKAGGSDDDDNMIPYRRVVEAICHRDRDILMERKQPEYLDENGVFSIQCWRNKWGDANNWEVWRALGKEYYSNK